MLTIIVATGLFVIAMVLSWFLQGRMLDLKWVKTSHLIWLVVTSFLLITGWFSLTLFLFLIIVGPIVWLNPSSAVGLYIMTIAVIPTYVVYLIPFPGLNYLIDLDVKTLFGFILLTPFCIVTIVNERKFNIIEICVLLFFTYISVQSFRTLPLTSSLRYFFVQILSFIPAYFVIARITKKIDKLEDTLKYLYSLSVILACIGLMSILKQWNFLTLYNFDTSPDYRYGFLRIGSPIAPTLFGFICGLGLLIFHSSLFDKNIRPYGLLTALIMLLSIFMTFARGAWLSVGLMFVFYTIFKMKLRKKTLVFYTVGILSAVAFLFMFSDYFSSSDEFGTIAYRQRLYEAAQLKIYENPFLGDPLYVESSYFDDLRLGNTVDIVSVYLQVVLEHGLVGLFLYLFPFYLVIKQLLKVREVLFNHEYYRKMSAVIISVLLSYLCMILTISDVSLIGLFGWILLAISQGFLTASKDVLKMS